MAPDVSFPDEILPSRSSNVRNRAPNIFAALFLILPILAIAVGVYLGGR